MLDILQFVFQDPWHFIGFIILWWALVSPFHIQISNNKEESKEDEKDGK